MLERFIEWVLQSERIVFFGGAGVSTESGIPDFRSAQGIYNQQATISPETILSHDFFFQSTAEFYAFYRRAILHLNAQPNVTHHVLAHLEKIGKLQAVITQNIDGLHQLAGSERVIELHGSVQRNHCVECAKSYCVALIANEQADQQAVPRCSCGGVIKPDVVLYGEALDQRDVSQAVAAVRQADLFIVGGTSLSVYPAASLVDYYQGERLVLINNDATAYDDRADLLIHKPLGEVMQPLMERLTTSNL